MNEFADIKVAIAMLTETERERFFRSLKATYPQYFPKPYDRFQRMK